MSSSSRRSNNDHSAPRGPGRSLSSVRRTSSQPPQPFQPPVIVSGTHSGTTGDVPWTNRPPSNAQGTAPGHAPHLYVHHTQPSRDDWDYLTPQLTGSTQLQPTSSHQLQIAVPELYPPTSSSQYDNPQSHDRLSSHSTTWSRDTRNLSLSHSSPVSPLVQAQTTSVRPNVLYSTQPQYPQTRNSDPQNYPPQRRPQQQQQQPSPPSPRPHNNTSSLSQPLVPPNASQRAPLNATQYNSLPSSSQHTGLHSSTYDIGHPAVAHQPPPPPNQNRRDASIRPTGPGGEGGGIPGEWGYDPQAGNTPPVSVAPRTAPRPVTTPLSAPQPVVPNIRQQARPSQPQAAPAVPRAPPTCIIPGCRKPVVKDIRTNELTEYCGEAHMIEALRTHGVLVCPACNRFPRRTGREYCGTSCEQWAVQQRQQQQQQWQQPQPQQQQRQQRQQRQGQQQSSAMGPYSQVPNPNSGSVTWSNVAVGPTSSSSVSSPRVRQDQFPW